MTSRRGFFSAALVAGIVLGVSTSGSAGLLDKVKAKLKPTPTPDASAAGMDLGKDNKNCTPTCYPAEAAGKSGGPCGKSGLACEPAGSKTARAINMVRY